MSYDFNTTPAPCDHHVARERMAFTLDRRTLYSQVNPNQLMARPVNGTAMVRLFLNDVEVPRAHPLLGWTVVPDAGMPAGTRFCKIVFNRVQLCDNWVIEVGYVTTTSFCVKCGASGLVSDYVLGPGGRWARVTDWPKLLQRCLKLVLTSVCPFYPALTCSLRSRIGKKGGPTFTSEDAATSVATVFSSMKTIQQAQAQFQALTPNEMMQNVGAVTAAPDPGDPRVIGVSIAVTTYGGISNVIDLGLQRS